MDKHLKNIKTLIDKNKVYERKVNILKEEIKNNSYERLTKKDYHNKSNNILVTSYKIR